MKIYSMVLKKLMKKLVKLPMKNLNHGEGDNGESDKSEKLSDEEFDSLLDSIENGENGGSGPIWWW